MQSLTPNTARQNRDWVNDLFHGFFPPIDTPRRWMPASEVREETAAYVLAMDLPGVREEDLEITLENDTLNLKGARHYTKPSEDVKSHIQERRFGAFERNFTFPTPVTDEGVTAEIKDGILVIRVPKVQDALPKKITVRRAQ